MEYTSKKYQGNQMLSKSTEVFERPTCATKHDMESIENLQPVNESKLIPWSRNKIFETNDESTFIPNEIFSLENIVNQEKGDKTHKDEIDLKFIAIIEDLNSGLHSSGRMLISSNILSRLPCSMKDNVDNKFHLNFSQKYTILLPSLSDDVVENTFNFLFDKLDFKDRRILKLLELFPVLEDVTVLRDSSCPLETDENNLIMLSTSQSKLKLLYNEKCSDSFGSDFDERCLPSQSTNCFLEKQSSIRCISNLKSHSVEFDYFTDLLQAHSCIGIPIERRIDEFKKQTDAPRNRQFSEKALHRSYGSSKQDCFRKYSYGDDCLLSNIVEKDDQSDTYSSQEIFTDQELSGKRLSSHIAEIRQKIEDTYRGVNCEMKRKEQQHESFVEQCERICNFTISFQDYDEIYNEEPLQNREMSLRASFDEIHEDSSSEHEIPDYCFEIRKTLKSSIHALRQIGTPVSYFHTLDQSKVSDFLDRVPKRNVTSVRWNEDQNQLEDLNFRRQIHTQSEALTENYPTYLKRIFWNLPHHIAVGLGAISVPFVVSILGRQ